MPRNPLDDVDWDAIKRYKKLVFLVPLFMLIAVGALTSYYIVQPEEEAGRCLCRDDRADRRSWQDEVQD